jgi:RNA polymerase sigma-70 factor (ECF subfamily)
VPCEPSTDDQWDWAAARRQAVRLARHYAGDPDDAEDIAQEALVRAWRARDSLRDAGRRSEWLAAIVRREAFRHAARARPESLEELEPDLAADDPRLRAATDRLDVRAVLRLMGARDRVLLVLRYGEDLTQPAIAHLLEVPEGTVKVQLHRARARLRRAYEHQ